MWYLSCIFSNASFINILFIHVCVYVCCIYVYVCIYVCVRRFSSYLSQRRARSSCLRTQQQIDVKYKLIESYYSIKTLHTHLFDSRHWSSNLDTGDSLWYMLEFSLRNCLVSRGWPKPDLIEWRNAANPRAYHRSDG